LTVREEERQFLLEVGSFRALLDQRLADLPKDSPPDMERQTYAFALWEYMLTWRERLSSEDWDDLLQWMIGVLAEELQQSEDA
jgi:hypothetical protein